jgi:threonylcarbamoyladenosine tRNA methylthiotransferase MtaB
MPQVAGALIRERAKQLRAAGETAFRKRLQAEIGTTRDVLIESEHLGRTEHYLPVAIAGEAAGSVVSRRIAGSDGERLTV